MPKFKLLSLSSDEDFEDLLKSTLRKSKDGITTHFFIKSEWCERSNFLLGLLLKNSSNSELPKDNTSEEVWLVDIFEFPYIATYFKDIEPNFKLNKLPKLVTFKNGTMRNFDFLDAIYKELGV